MSQGVLFAPGTDEWTREDEEFTSPLSSESMRVLRGGAFDDPPESLRAAKRNGQLPAFRFVDNGMRVASTVRCTGVLVP
jgi:formylglycine-generating enzyme required for sulfatase activity